MRTDAVRFATNSSERRSLLCATKASATDQSTLSPRPDGTTRLPSRRPRALRGGGSAQPIKGCSSEISARDSLRPRVVKANPSACGRGQLNADGAVVGRGLARDDTLQDGRQAGDRASQLPGVWPLAVDADGRTLRGTGAPFVRQGLRSHRPDAERRRRVTASSNRNFVHSCWSA